MYQTMILNLCIARMETSVPKSYVYEKIKELKLGYIQKLTEIAHRKNDTHKRILIKLKCNENTEEYKKINEIMQKFGCIKLMYDMPDFWKIEFIHQ